MPNIQFQFRRGTSSEWSSANPTLASGEIGIETDTDLFKIGDGATVWNSLAYGGIQGVQGIQGTTGSQGTAGVIGVDGAQGTQGIQGTTGSQGTAGVIGIDGAQGTQGIQGTTGSQGTAGVIGIDGAQGTQGIQGIQGTTGSQGTAGVIGVDGAQGTQGIQGIQGATGSAGAQGIQGIQGTIGSQGVQGTQGIQGPIAGGNTQVIFNDSNFANGSAAFTFNKTSNTVTVTGDVVASNGDLILSDGATFETIVQAIPATANQVISFPDATGVVGLVAGSNTQIPFNGNGAYSASANLTFDTSSSLLTVTGSANVTSTLTTSNANVTGTLFANNSQLSLVTLTYGATTDLNFAAITGDYATISLTGDVTFTTSNRAAGRSAVLRIICDATARNFTFPVGWKFLGASAPTSIAASKTAVLSVTLFGANDTDAVCAYSVEP